MPIVNAYKVTQKRTQVLIQDTKDKTFSLPLLPENTLRNLRVDIVGWRYDQSVPVAVAHPDSNLIGSRAVAVSRDGAAVSVASPVQVLPTTVPDGAGPPSSEACDFYDKAGFGTTADGLSPLTVTYQPGAGGLDGIKLAWAPKTADQGLVASVSISYDDFPLDITPTT